MRGSIGDARLRGTCLWEMHAYEMHAYERHVYERHAYKVHADEVYPSSRACLISVILSRILVHGVLNSPITSALPGT
jgi:hypothetical protein